MRRDFRAHALLLAGALALLAPGGAVDAQVRIGLHGGMTRSSFAGGSVAQLDETRGGHLIGAIIGLRLHSRLVLETGAEYARKGGTGTRQTIEGPSPLGLDIGYVQVPLVVRWELPELGRFRPALFGGTAFAHEVACDTEQGLFLGTNVTCDEGAGERGTNDWSALLGAGVGLDLGRTHFRLDARYDLGLTNLYAVTDAVTVRNRSIVLSAGVVTRLGR